MQTTRVVQVGTVSVGGDAPVSVQSMTNTDTRDVEATVRQILALESAGCDIVRASVYDRRCAESFSAIRERIHIPLVADVHFDHCLAILAIEHGADKLRINPGNIGGPENVKKLVDCAKAHHIPIRIGVNAGSLEADLKQKYGAASPEAMVESALRHVRMLEQTGFHDTVISLKASTVANTVAAYRRMAELVDYPLHIGVTETGSVANGIIKSAIGIGALLLDGIGNTLRVSLTDSPVREVETGLMILKALNLRKDDIEIISCPTCGRTRVDLMKAVSYVEEHVHRNAGYLRIAVMGCAVNGPGEAADADIGIAFGASNGVLFKNGQKFAAGAMPEIMTRLVDEANTMLDERKAK